MNGQPDPRIDILGNSSIGIFGFSTDKYTLLPYNIKSNLIEAAETILKNDVILSTVANSHLNGLFAMGNSNHLLLPGLVSNEELDHIASKLNSDVTVHVLDSKITALGNTIVASDGVALVHPEFTMEEKKQISEMLDVEVETHDVGISPLIGSLMFRSNKGFLVHPYLEDEEIEWLSSFFKVQGDVVTVNRGLPYPRLGIIANKNGILVGSDTTGPEILRIYEMLG
ncbi:MAG: translation initiation factor IF-6 [Deltaproteobacteria bacterium]|nr:translation initiation factor IF-6 [Deltaproteobacteria bacterium]